MSSDEKYRRSYNGVQTKQHIGDRANCCIDKRQNGICPQRTLPHLGELAANDSVHSDVS